MPHSLAKKINDQVAVGYQRISTPTYTIYPEDYAGGAIPPDGWVYYPYIVTPEDFAEQWKPDGTTYNDAGSTVSGYPLGAIVEHNKKQWRSQIEGNVWEPGVSGWADVNSDVPEWIQPTGSHNAYVIDAVVRHNDKLWKSLVSSNVWEPGVSGWREEAMLSPEGEEIPPEWVQPTGAHDAYQIDDVVTHNGEQWKSTVSDNVWEPGVYGWVSF